MSRNNPAQLTKTHYNSKNGIFVSNRSLASSPQETAAENPCGCLPHHLRVSPKFKKWPARDQGLGGLSLFRLGLQNVTLSSLILHANSNRTARVVLQWARGGINPIPQRRANPPVSARRAISPSLGSFCLFSLFFGLLALALDLTGSLCCAVLACHVSFCDDAPNCRGPNRHSRWAVICRQKADRRTPNVDH